MKQWKFDSSIMIDPRQVVAARALLGWTQAQLASHAQIGSNTLKVFEKSQGNTTPVIVGAIQRTLEDNGIVFHNADGRIGVSLAVD